MAKPDQDSTLRALLAGDSPGELIFDPITDNDSTGSCLGCAYSVVAAAAIAVGLYAAAHRGWEGADRFLTTAGKGGTALFMLFLSGSLFTLAEFFSSKEIYVLVQQTRQLELRRRRWSSSTVLQSWSLSQVLGFRLDPLEGDAPPANSCLYVVLEGLEPIKLLEACYPRDFVARLERKLSDICDVSSSQ